MKNIADKYNKFKSKITKINLTIFLFKFKWKNNILYNTINCFLNNIK